MALICIVNKFSISTAEKQSSQNLKDRIQLKESDSNEGAEDGFSF